VHRLLLLLFDVLTAHEIDWTTTISIDFNDLYCYTTQKVCVL